MLSSALTSLACIFTIIHIAHSLPQPAAPAATPSSLIADLLTLPGLNTSLSNKKGINYHVPGSVIDLHIVPGDLIDYDAMRKTLIGSRADVARDIYHDDQWGYGPIDPDPYVFPYQVSRYTGLEVRVYSTGAKEIGGMSWRQLDAVIKGLQEALYDAKIYREAQFLIYDDLTAKKLQGNGRLYKLTPPSDTS